MPPPPFVLSLLLLLLLQIVVVVGGEWLDSAPTTPGSRNETGTRNSAANSSVGVLLLSASTDQVVIDNGLLHVAISVPGGDVTGIQYNGLDNVLDVLNNDDNRGYWDVVWNLPGHDIIFDRVHGSTYKIVSESSDQIEISFNRTWSISTNDTFVPMNIDKRYIFRSGCSGFYTYAIFDRPEGWPDIEIDQVRIVYKLREDKFQYMALSDDSQRFMPTAGDRSTGLPLAYPEAVLLTNPENQEFRGEVDDKYQYSIENQYNRVHGWICDEPPAGFWMITPSNEFRTAGPVKQDLTSHVGPITLSMFVSTHYAGKEVGMKFNSGEAWRKVFGPVFVYLNSASPEDGSNSLWEDAKRQMYGEVKIWPYDFTACDDFPNAEQRGSVVGQLFVHDGYISEQDMYGASAYVGLAAPGPAGSWQRENKGYQFWTRANKRGLFEIEKVRAGDYNLYAWVPGFIGDYKYDTNITITPGCSIDLGTLVYEPPRHGPTLWEIGIPDRTAAEFYIPSPYPTLMNSLYTDNRKSRFRQYGLWDRYADLYQEHDLIFTVGTDHYRKDWFYAQVTRNAGNTTYQSTTFQIVFELQQVNDMSTYYLQLALASAMESDLQVRFNNASVEPAHFSTGPIGQDNAIARHGIHGLYWLYGIEVPSFQLHGGINTIYLTQASAKTPFQGVMYDYIRLEGPPET
ncbi:hypothetical protein MLD38_005025 [Melastoma candidum]|uniref:Uncharacterized protein n=1 Tax=Melastoma candidum TaxID=119954 RepID=A0ACB9S7K0_9MYRT|nr:hypothetical protein MLD38_005025 [Melastoma candidum]